MITNKKCIKCGKVKSISEFRKDVSKKDGKHSYCNCCNKNAQREWYHKNMLRARKNANNFYHKNSKKIKARRKIARVRDKDKISQKRKIHYSLNKNLYKERSWKNAGIKDMSIKRYSELLKIQKNRCAICKIHQKKLKRKLNVDHNHKNGKSRGLLCDSCNRALGYFKDSTPNLEIAINYLIKHK